MALAAGTRMGPYEILSPLGAGGMGEAHRARCTRLGREVAINVLPAVASVPERPSQFETEAGAESALNHPVIVMIYDVGQTHGVSRIAMEPGLFLSSRHRVDACLHIDEMRLYRFIPRFPRPLDCRSRSS